MKRLLRRINAWLELFGVDLRKTAHSFRALPAYLRDRRAFEKQAAVEPREFALGRAYPCLGEQDDGSGQAQGHYFHQDLLVARRIWLNQPTLHVDVGSRVDGFVAHVAAFRRIEVLDIRPQRSEIENVRFIQADLMTPVSDRLVDYCDSLSCLHALEHFGLGRYGDPLRWDGHLTGLNNLGRFYFSVPIGPQRIEFNAHRVFSVGYLLAHLKDTYRIERFSFVDDAGALHENVGLSPEDVNDNFGCQYGCGIFEMVKL